VQTFDDGYTGIYTAVLELWFWKHETILSTVVIKHMHHVNYIL
jgi:hypothetical protein